MISFIICFNMAHDHAKNENSWLGEFMLLSIKMMAIKHSNMSRIYNQSRITNNAIQIYNITSQLIKFLLALNFVPMIYWIIKVGMWQIWIAGKAQLYAGYEIMQGNMTMKDKSYEHEEQWKLHGNISRNGYGNAIIGRYGGCFEEDIMRLMYERAYHPKDLYAPAKFATTLKMRKGNARYRRG